MCKVMSLITHHVVSKSVIPSLIFETQIEIFLIKSESFLTLYRQQRNYHIQGPEKGHR